MLESFKIFDKLSQGAFGQVYNGLDLSKKNGEAYLAVIIKFTQEHEMNDQEFEILKEVQSKSNKDYFPMALAKGRVIIKDPTLKQKNVGPTTTI